MKCHHPDVFCCAILNSQPMGFYAPAQLVRDAQSHGVEVRPIDVNHSRWDCTLEDTGGRTLAVRLGLRMAKGLSNEAAARILAARDGEPFASVEALWRRSGVPVAALDVLSHADAFGSLGLDRRGALWAIKGLSDAPLPLFAAADAREGTLLPEIAEPAVSLAPMSLGREVVEDYRSKGLSLRPHPLAFLRGDLDERRIRPCAALRTARDGGRITVAGLVLVRQRPGSASGVLFVTLEDETEVANLVIWPALFERQRRVVLAASLVAARGRVQREGEVIHLVAEHLTDLTGLLRSLSEREETFPLPHGRGDEASHGGGPDPRDALGRKARDIYVPDISSREGIEIRTRDFK
jgi:error-prone DNA polymerase